VGDADLPGDLSSGLVADRASRRKAPIDCLTYPDSIHTDREPGECPFKDVLSPKWR
jgi:hypothetical protein